MLSELLEYQIVFEFLPWNQNEFVVRDSTMEVQTSSGGYKSLVGNFVLRPGRVYAFSFQTISSLNFKVGVVLKKHINDLSANGQSIAGGFSDGEFGYAFYSQGFKRHNESKITNTPKIGEPIGPGDVVTCVFDSAKGSLSVYVNKEFYALVYVEKSFTTEEFYPAIALLGDREKLRLTYYDV